LPSGVRLAQAHCEGLLDSAADAPAAILPSTVQLSGHNVLILFPSDIPAGPTTIQYIGHVEYTVDAQGVFTVTKTTGRQVDICAALSN